MAISITQPTTAHPLVGPGQRCIVSGLASASSGDWLNASILDSATLTEGVSGIVKLNAGDTSKVVQWGVTDAALFGPLPILNNGDTIITPDGTAMSIWVRHYTASLTLVEQATFTGYTFTNLGHYWGLLRKLETDISANGSDLSALAADIAIIKAAVLRVYSNA